MTPLVSYYDDKVIFTTGLTGCMGMVMAEKLLRCTRVKRIYGLVRAKPGQEQQRLHETWLECAPNVAQRMIADGRVVAVNGDIAAGPLLGMDEATAQRIRDEAHIVMSLAADISLGKKAKDLAATNIYGVLAVAELARSCSKLERFVFVSTLYSQSHQLAAFGEDLAQIAGSNPEDELTALMSTGPAFDISPWHYGYAYAKNLVERLLVQRYPNLPTLIIRPAVVGPAMADPEPLWTHNTSMPLWGGLIMCSMLPKTQAIEHASQQEPHQNFFDEVPVDYVVSCLIAHTGAGTLGPVNAGTGSVPFTTAQIIGDNFDLLPPAVWRKDITIADLKGFMSLYKIFAIDHPRGLDGKTRRLVQKMTAADLAVLPIDIDRIDLAGWHAKKGALFRTIVLAQQAEAAAEAATEAAAQAVEEAAAIAKALPAITKASPVTVPVKNVAYTASARQSKL